MDAMVEDFERERLRLVSLGYRLTGSFADAEDAVQEAWLRLSAADGQIRDLRAWLTTVVSRICLDRLRSAAKRRETYVGQWLPEPVVTPLDHNDPLDAVVRDEDSRLAAMIVLDTMTAEQRVAFVLHDGFGVPFNEIAALLDISVPAARQHASRARRSAATAPAAVPDEAHSAAVGNFLAAMATGDIATIVATLHPDAVVIGDANGSTSTAINVIHGAHKAARFFLGLLRRYDGQPLEALQPVTVNGQLGLATYGWTGATAAKSSPARITAFTVKDARVLAAYDLANAEKFSGVRLPDWPRRQPPTAPGTTHPN